MCSYCGQVALIDWPDDAARIWSALAERPLMRNRNWFPSGHPLALASGAAHGQCAEELLVETRTNEGPFE